MAEYLIVLVVAALVTWLLTPVVRRMAIRLGAVVSPDARRVHERPTPTLGGAAMYGGFLAALATASVLPQFRPVFRGTSEPLGLLIGATVMFAVGALDDLREVSPPAKLAGQVFSGSLLSLLGITLLFFRIPFAGFVVLSPDLSPLLTVIWVALMANAVNLIDGLDGLAAGVVGIAGVAFFAYSLRLSDSGLLAGSNLAPLVAIIAVGVCVGFLPRNAHPAKIFMGDAGALFLGLLLAASTILVGGRTADQFSGQTFFFFAPLVIPFVILGVPCSTPRWRCCVAPPGGRRSPCRTRNTSTTASWRWAMASAGRCSSSGRGRPSWPVWCSPRPTRTRATPWSPSGSPPWP